MQLQVSGSNNSSGSKQGTATACNESCNKLQCFLCCLLSLSLLLNKAKQQQNPNPPNSSQTLTSEGSKHEQNNITSFHQVQIQKEKIHVKVRTPSQHHNAALL